MRRIKLFEQFTSIETPSRIMRYGQIQSINESTLNAAKSYMEKVYASENSIDPKELTPEQKVEALTNKGYQEIRKMLEEKNQFGYALPFVKFHFEQNIPIGKRYPDIKEIDLGESLVQEANKIPIADLKTLLVVLSEKKNIVSRLPRQLAQYATSEKIDNVPGFEALVDDIRTISREDGAKWLFTNLYQKQREEYRNATPEEKKDFVTAAYTLKDLGQSVSDRFMAKIRVHKDKSFSDLMKEINKFLAGYSNVEMQKKMEEIASLVPQVGVLYFEDGYLALSVRTEEAQKKLFTVANWCINRGSWTSYAGKKGSKGLQINIFDYNRDLTDRLFLTGTTISYEGFKVTTSHDIADSPIKKSENPEAHFKALGYPQEAVSAIIESLPGEIAIKQIIEDMNLGFGGGTTQLIKSLLSLEKGKVTGRVSETIWQRIISSVADILTDGKHISKPKIIAHCKEHGLISKETISVFDSIMSPGDYTRNDMEEIYASTLENFESLEFLEQLYDSGKMKKDTVPGQYEKVKQTIKDKPITLDILKRKIENG
jgi:hypothetical protein